MHSPVLKSPASTMAYSIDPCTSQDSRTDNQKWIDLQIQELEEKTRRLKETRNLDAPIFKLPNELLAEIFLWLSWLSLGEWMKGATHVCSSWRTLALNCRNLWNHSFPAEREWIGEFMERSKGSLLNVEISIYDSLGAKHMAENFLPHIPRIKVLSIMFPVHPTSQHTGILNIVKSTPILKALQLGVGSYHTSGNGYFVLPDHLRLARFPQLSEVALISCAIQGDVAVPLLTNLTYLVMGMLPNGVRLPLPKLLDILENCPLLETLQLVEAIPNVSLDKREEPRRTISLSSLRHLTLQDNICDCAILLDSLSFPTHTTLKLSGAAKCLIDVRRSGLLHTLATNTASPERPLGQLTIYRLTNRNVGIRGWVKNSQSLSFDFAMELPGIYRQLEHISLILNALPLAQLDTIVFGSTPQSVLFPENFWAHRLGGLDKLQTLVIAGPCTFPILVPVTGGGERSFGEGFPTLKTILFERIDINKPGYANFFELLRASLEGKHSVQEIQFSRCCIKSSNIARLQEVVLEISVLNSDVSD